MLEKLKDPKFRILCAFVSRSWIINEYEFDYEKMIEAFNDDVKQLENPLSPWYDGKHGGDCTNAPGACLRCHVEAAITETEELLKNMSDKKEEFLPLEKQFHTRGFDFEFVKSLKGGWQIYKKTKTLSKKDAKDKCHAYVKYELILPLKNKEGMLRGKFYPNRLSYPGDEAFGKNGYDCISIEVAEKRHSEILARKEEKIEQEARKLNLPKDKTFTIKDLEKLNKDWTYNTIYARLRELVVEGRIAQTGTKDNDFGKPSKVYKFVK